MFPVDYVMLCLRWCIDVLTCVPVSPVLIKTLVCLYPRLLVPGSPVQQRDSCAALYESIKLLFSFDYILRH